MQTESCYISAVKSNSKYHYRTVCCTKHGRLITMFNRSSHFSIQTEAKAEVVAKAEESSRRFMGAFKTSKVTT